MFIKTKKNGKRVLCMTREEAVKIGRICEAKWGKKDVVNPAEKGKYEGKSKDELESMLTTIKKKQDSYKKKHDGKADSKLTGKIRELQFAIRAKSGWGKVD